MTKDKKIDRRSIALSLYLNGNYTQEEIATKVGTTRQTIIRWAREDAWQELKASQSITPTQLIKQWIQQIVELHNVINQRPEGERHPTNQETDIINKLSKSIKDLQAECGIAEVISVCQRFLTWLRPVDAEQAKLFNNLMDAFIKDQIKR